MTKQHIITDIIDNLETIINHLGLLRFMPRGLISNIGKHLSKLNNFVLSELMVTLKIISSELVENNWKK
tara:strand:+ start:114 stop:320 length:207 start_codon:yes stop_codon:yes gene_type:complete